MAVPEHVAVASIPAGSAFATTSRPATHGVRGPTTGDATPLRSPHLATIVTPEAVLLEFRAAGIASRLLAKIIDVVVQGMALFSLLFAMGFLAGTSGTSALVIGIVGGFLVIFGYPTLEAFWNGQTLGKKALGLSVISVEGSPIRFRHAAIRSIIGVFEFLLPPGGLPALVSALVSRRSQRIGDLAAGTVVIRNNRTSTRPVFWAPPRGLEPFAFTFDAGRLTPPRYAIVREFLMRAHEFETDARNQLARQLAKRVEEWTVWPRPQAVHPELYLLSAAFAYQRRFAGRSPLIGAAPPLPSRPPPPPYVGQPPSPYVGQPPPPRG